MALKGQRTTADYLPWEEYQILLLKLKRDNKHRLAAIIALGTNTMLRFTDFARIKWSDILDSNMLVITESKTGKERKILINDQLKEIVKEALVHEGRFKVEETIVNCSIQYLNRKLKAIRKKYNLSLRNISTHTFRKTSGRRLCEKHNYSGEILFRLMDLFNHSSLNTTKRYLGIRQDEINNLYSDLCA